MTMRAAYCHEQAEDCARAAAETDLPQVRRKLLDAAVKSRNLAAARGRNGAPGGER
ncbi:hypothetical protein [Sphingomonas sp.]|uniref:hypothetical protein n=1 Tax=Sphingomonas sp. TaxID=28214 RepID=UPI0025DD3581|nr:hypothetical protein [Sphingomonas sp.]MBV9527891.1 hypothetical protein [Sphingomonas sp.]